jgi:hypothetical protein
MRGPGGTLSPRASRRKTSGCYFIAPVLALCLSIAFLILMASGAGQSKEERDLIEVSSAQQKHPPNRRELSESGQGSYEEQVLPRGYERARRLGAHARGAKSEADLETSGEVAREEKLGAERNVHVADKRQASEGKWQAPAKIDPLQLHWEGETLHLGENLWESLQKLESSNGTGFALGDSQFTVPGGRLLQTEAADTLPTQSEQQMRMSSEEPSLLSSNPSNFGQGNQLHKNSIPVGYEEKPLEEINELKFSDGNQLHHNSVSVKYKESPLNSRDIVIQGQTAVKYAKEGARVTDEDEFEMFKMAQVGSSGKGHFARGSKPISLQSFGATHSPGKVRGSVRKQPADLPDQDLSRAVLSELSSQASGDLPRTGDSLQGATNSLPNGGNSFSAASDGQHLLNRQQSSSEQTRGSLNDFQQEIVGAFEEGLACMESGLPLFDGNLTLMTGASAYDSCAFVGNSGMLRAAEDGAKIDGHEVVLRSNQAPTKGKKTSCS